MLGLPKGELFLIPWTNEWVEEFSSEKENIQEVLGQKIVAVHQIGSTAVKQLSAKPVIDIAIELKEFKDGESCIAPLETLGYSYIGAHILPERYYFIKGEPRTHQIHMYLSGSNYLCEQLYFRDYLRNNEKTRIQYAELKQKLATVNKGDKHKYAADKTEFVKSILNKEQEQEINRIYI